jgi:hypothetical protein
MNAMQGLVQSMTDQLGAMRECERDLLRRCASEFADSRRRV